MTYPRQIQVELVRKFVKTLRLDSNFCFFTGCYWLYGAGPENVINLGHGIDRIRCKFHDWVYSGLIPLTPSSEMMCDFLAYSGRSTPGGRRGVHKTRALVVGLSSSGRKFLSHQFSFLEPPIFLDLKMNLPATSLKPAFLSHQCLSVLSRTTKQGRRFKLAFKLEFEFEFESRTYDTFKFKFRFAIEVSPLSLTV